MWKIYSIAVIQGEEDQLLQQACAMLIEDGNHGTLRLLGAADEVDLVLQTSVQEEETGVSLT